MKFLVLISCALSVAQAGFASPYYYNTLILPNGAPLDTPEVQLAKAAHFEAHAKARYGAPVLAPLFHYGQPLAYNALPLDTPEVAAAKAQHFHDYAVAAQRNGVHVAASPLALGHPVDTHEVQVAKAAHFAAHAEAAARAHGAHYRRRRDAYPLHYPVIDHNGVPVETPEVQAAKAHHFAEFARVASRSDSYVAAPAASVGYYAHPQPVDNFAPAYYRGPGGPPAQLGPDGQPIETHEVQAAKAAHFAAHAALRGGHFGHY